jgi:hypothetical protein
VLVVPQMSKVELYAAIRRDHRGGMPMRELERKHGVTWRTARKALDSSWPEPCLCAAIVDRLTFNGTIIETGTGSNCLAATGARAEQ